MTDQKETRAIVGQLKADHLSLRSGVIGVARTAHATITNGGAGLILSSNSAAISRGGAAAMLAGDSMTVTQGGGSIMAAGNTMTVTQGGGQVLIAGRSMMVTQGGGGIMVAGQAKVEKGFVAVLISNQTVLDDGARVLLGMPQAAVLGALFGLVFAVARRWLRRGEQGS